MISKSIFSWRWYNEPRKKKYVYLQNVTINTLIIVKILFFITFQDIYMKQLLLYFVPICCHINIIWFDDHYYYLYFFFFLNWSFIICSFLSNETKSILQPTLKQTNSRHRPIFLVTFRIVWMESNKFGRSFFSANLIVRCEEALIHYRWSTYR